MEELVVDTKLQTDRQIEDDAHGDFKITISGFNGDKKETSVENVKQNTQNKVSEDSKNSNENLVFTKNSCTFFEASSGCKFGDKCRFQHYRATVDAGCDTEETLHLNDSISGKQPLNKKASDEELENELCNRSHEISSKCSNENEDFYKNDEDKEIMMEQATESKENCVEKMTKSISCKYYVKQGNNFDKNCQSLHSQDVRNQVIVTEQIKIGTMDKKDSAKNLTSTNENPETSSAEGKHKEILTSDSEHTISSDVKNTGTKRRVCRFLKTIQGCKKGKKCLYLHETHEQMEKNQIIDNRTEGSEKSSGDKKHVEDTNTTKSVTVEGKHKEKNEDNHVGGQNYKLKHETEEYNKAQNTNNNEEKVCFYFNSPRGCKKGRKCPNIHTKCENSKSEEVVLKEDTKKSSIDKMTLDNEHTITSDVKDTGTERKVFSYSRTKRGNRKGEKCPNLHETSEQKGRKEIVDKSNEDSERSYSDKVYVNSINNENGGRGKFCEYFNSDRGCINGEECPNIHENCKQTISKDNQTISKGNEVKNKSKKLCRYLNTVKGCTKNNCLYLHVNDHQDESPAKYQNAETICKFFLSTKGCMNGENCPNSHTTTSASPIELKSKAPPVQKTTDELRTTELAQLEKRFTGGKCSLAVREPNTIYHVQVSPTDPDWPFLVKEFELAIDFPKDYPKQLFKVTLQDSDQFPPQFAKFMNEKLQKWCEERAVNRKEESLDFRPFLKWFDKNLIKMFQESATMVKLQLEARQTGITLIHHDDILPKQTDGNDDGVNGENENSTGVDGHSTVDTPSNDSEGDSAIRNTQNASEGNSASTIEAVSSHNASEEMSCEDTNTLFGSGDDSKNAACGKKVKKGTEIKLPNLYLSENVALMTIKSALLTVECNRCRCRNDFKVKHFKDSKGASSNCKNCSTFHSVTYHSELIHQHSPVAGYLHLDGCKAFDFILNDSVIGLVCFECDKENIIKGMVVGSKKHHWCQHCSNKIDIHVKNVKFTILNSSGVAVNKHANEKKQQEPKKKVPKEPGIREGQPLPDNGACKHYKKSFRWLRFPCCGKAYPCDICHEDKEGGEHEMKFAAKMICGFCSKEQPFFKDKACTSCKENVTKGHSTHWEGGKGCRDKSKMARNDKQKTAGEGKTISRKKENDQNKTKKK